MPEVSGETTIYIYLTSLDFKEMQEMLYGSTKVFSFGTVTRKNDGSFEIESNQEVSLEFDLSDYAPDYSWRD